MKRVTATLGAWNQKLDEIFLEPGQKHAYKKNWERQKNNNRKQGERRQRFLAFLKEHRWELFFVLLMGCLLFGLSWILPFDEAPDEKMRYMIPTYIYNHGTLPAGWEEEIRSKIWGISYAFHPILPYIFGGYLMKLVSIFNSSEHALLMAARFINILFGMGFYWYVLQLAKKLFQRKLFRCYFVALLAMLPQLLYLFTYVNTDGVALFSSAMLIYYWLVGMERKWDRGSCTALAVGVSFCALSYFNAYGFALFSVVLFVGSLLVFYHKHGIKECVSLILKRGIYITVIVFFLTGWWFIRCGILYDGDFLGLSAPAKYGEMYAMEEYKPSVKQSLQEQGVSLSEMLRSDNGGMEWIRTTYRSTIGYFGYYKYALGIDIYEIHKRLLLIGALGIFLILGLGAARHLRRWFGAVMLRLGLGRALPEAAEQKLLSWKEEKIAISGMKMHPVNFWMLQFSFCCCIIIPVLLSLYYSYTDDFQPQGRYIMPMILPVMYFVAAGTERFVTLFFRKWFVWIVMIPLFYAVLHVFLGAFVSVYIPTFVEELSSWADIRFSWFSNNVWLVRLLHLLIPG